MNIDDIARRAGRDLREAVHVDVVAAFDELHRVAPRRRRAHALVTVAAAASVLLLVVGAAQLLGNVAPKQASGPVGRPTAMPSEADQQPGLGCSNPLITCHDGRTYTVALGVPMTWTLPPGFGAPYSGADPTDTFVETYRLDGSGGVSVFQHVNAAAEQAVPRAVPAIRTAEALADWIAERPFLSSSTIRETEVAGLPAWTVEVVVRRGMPEGPATCNSRIACYPVLFVPATTSGWVAGAWEGMTSQYTVLDLPSSGVMVVWSWTFDTDFPPAADTLVDTIRLE